MQVILIIIGIQVLYVTFFTIRMIVMLKGMKNAAALLATVEVAIYVSGLSMVLDRLNEPINLIAYCLGYRAGVIVGSKIEERMALGYRTVQIITDTLHLDLPNTLRERDYGVTTWLGEGRDGQRLMMSVLTRRKHHARLLQTIEELDPKAFVTSHEPPHFRGGFWTRLVK